MLFLAMATVGLASCASSRYYVRRPVPPPPVGAYYRGPAPGVGFVWRGGYYNWNRGRYNWVGGAWVRPPRRGSVWVNPGWNGRVWRRGRWR